MRYAIISDVHANPVALRAVLSDAQNQQVDAVVCLGDTVGYGPLPRPALQLVRQSCSIVLLGNHDWAVGGRATPNDYANLADESIARHRDELSARDREWLANLPRTATFQNAAATHADFTGGAQFFYVETPEDAQANFAARPEQLLFVGHTHTPALFVTGRSGAVYALPPEDFVLEDGKRYLVNPGSVGYPREKDGKCFSSYIIYDVPTASVYFRKVPFDVSGLLQRGKKKFSRRARRLLVGLGIALLCILFGSIAAALVPSTGPAASVSQSKPPVARRTLALSKEDTAVRANLKLAKNSPPVALEVRFLTANGTDAAPLQVVSVRKSSQRAFKIPPKAVQAVFSILRTSANDKPKIQTFSPAKASRETEASTPTR